MELKQKMSFEKMERHMKENTILVPSKVSVEDTLKNWDIEFINQ